MTNIESIITKIENKTFNIDDLNNIRNFTPEEIVEITKIEDKQKRLFLSKSYITTFNEKKFKEACLIDENLKEYFSDIWFEECLNNTPESIVSSYMIPNLFSSNMLGYIRDNITNKNENKSDLFEEQIYKLYKYLKSNEDFIIKMSYSLKEDLTDNEILNNDALFRKEFSDLKNNFNKLDELWTLFFLIMDNKESEYNSFSRKITIKHKNIAYNFLPRSVYENLSVYFKEDDHFDLSDIFINSNQEDIEIIDNNKNDIEIVKNDKSSVIFNNKNKRSLSLKNKPEKRGNAKKILLIVFLLLVSFVTFLWFVNSIFAENNISSTKIVTQEELVETEVDLNYKGIK